jgi:PTH2 family peptidyl-tRNA hydrolase
MMQETNQPSTANIALACAILAGVTGYFLGTAKSLGLFGGSPVSEPLRKHSEKEEEEDTSEDESSDDDDEDDDTAPAEFPGHTEECKMVLVVRTDLGMTKGMYICLYDVQCSAV